MDKKKFLQFKARLSKINELRRRFWTMLREFRTEFLSLYPHKDFKDDPQWQEIMGFLNDMWESTIKEEARRQLGIPRKDCPTVRPKSGLYASNRLCIVCHLPLTDWQKSYCSEKCRNISRSRKYRKDHPEEKQKANLKYLKFCHWEVIGEKYPVGSVIEGKIKNITDFGIFIGIDEGIDGLVHISDISWTKRFKHPSELYKKGQVVQAKVLYIDKENERFSLSIKELIPNPWQTIEERFPA